MIKLEDIEYIRQVRSGNIGAFTVIVDRYKDMVFNVVFRIISDRQHAEDVTQDVFIKVFQSLGKFKEHSKFSTWLYRITYNTAISATRKAKHKHMQLHDFHEDYEGQEFLEDSDELNKEDKLRCVEKVLQQMTAESSLLVTLYYMEDQSIADVSEITGLSQANVKIRLYRIRKYMIFEVNKLLEKDEYRK